MTVTSASAEIFDKVLAGLTSGQRFGALSRFDEAGSNEWRMGNWFLTGIFFLLVLLLLLFIFVSIERARKEKKVAKLSVARKGRQIGLTPQQLQMVTAIANKSGLPNKEGVFSIEEAFDCGAEKIIEQNLAKGLVREEVVQLKAELAGLREKLGFKNKASGGAVEKTARTNQPTGTRLIPAGRVVYLTRRTNPGDRGIETAIIENNENEMRVRLPDQVKINFGDRWRVSYDYGASVWEFQSSVIGYDGNILRLSHNDNVRFVSRRRFSPVQVRQQALLAVFPFAEQTCADGVESPVFLPATVIEIAGPWLRLETAYQMQAGGRALVVMKVSNAVAKPLESGFESQTIQDISEVKNTEQKGGLCIISVELSGISDSDIDHLLNVAKRAAIKAEAQQGAAGEEKTEVVVISGANTGS
jgi:hypothetical protein